MNRLVEIGGKSAFVILHTVLGIYSLVPITILLYFASAGVSLADGQVVVEKNATGSIPINEMHKQDDWDSYFTFEGRARPGVYTIDPHVWVYTREFAERFGMPEEWVSDELHGVAAVAWRNSKTGYMTCGWGGKKDACKEDDFSILELYFDARKVELPWASWSRESDMLAISHWGNSQRFLVPQECEVRRDNSVSSVGAMGVKCKSRVAKQPLADPENSEEIFLFSKLVNSSKQGSFIPIYAYDKRVFSSISWIQIPYSRPSGMYGKPGAVEIDLETRVSPYGKAKRKFHKIILPIDFDRRVKLVSDSDLAVKREFYKSVTGFK